MNVYFTTKTFYQRNHSEILGNTALSAFIDFFLLRIKENELAREQEKMEEKKDREEMRRLLVQHQWEQRMEKARQAELKRDLMQAHLVQFLQRSFPVCGAISQH